MLAPWRADRSVRRLLSGPVASTCVQGEHRTARCTVELPGLRSYSHGSSLDVSRTSADAGPVESLTYSAKRSSKNRWPQSVSNAASEGASQRQDHAGSSMTPDEPLQVRYHGYTGDGEFSSKKSKKRRAREKKELATLAGSSPANVSAVTALLGRIGNLVFQPGEAEPKSVTVFAGGSGAKLIDLVQQLPPIAIATSPPEPLLVVLVTPSFAAELESDAAVLPAALARLLDKPQLTADSIEILTAVVDRLPIASHVRGIKELFAQVPASHGRHGLEGICVASTSAAHLSIGTSEIDNWSSASSRFTHSLEPEKPATLKLSIHADHSSILNTLLKGKQSNSNVGARAFQNYSLQIPLPSTLFTNGRQHTQIHSIYSRGWGAEKWILQSKRDVKHAEVLLPFSSHSPKYSSSWLRVPLVKLTEQQSVVSCMGNIVREVQAVSEANDDSLPASTALEAAVAKYFTDTGIPPHAMSVWALVTPYELRNANPVRTLSQKLVEFDKSATTLIDGPFTMRPLSKALNQGVRLCRVTSGGGGWGNKAGLLSLQPDIMFHQKPKSESPGDESGGLESILDMSPVASEGDILQFFFSPLDDKDLHASAWQEYHRRGHPLKSAFEVGVIPTTSDEELMTANAATSESTARSVDNERSERPIVAPNFFGVLSEQGFAVEFETNFLKDEGIKTDRHATRIDVPFSTFRSSEWSPIEGEGDDESISEDDLAVVDTVDKLVQESKYRAKEAEKLVQESKYLAKEAERVKRMGIKNENISDVSSAGFWTDKSARDWEIRKFKKSEKLTPEEQVEEQRRRQKEDYLRFHRMRNSLHLPKFMRLKLG